MYFSIERIKKAIEHLQGYNSNWVIVPLVFAVNGVNSANETSFSKKSGRIGGDPFLNKHFSGDLMGLKAFNTGCNSLRPRFVDIYGNMEKSGRGDDFVLHQNTKLWANIYSSRGYREMRTSKIIIGSDTRAFQLTDEFEKTWENKLPSSFAFEELLVWLYAFSGIDDSINSWQKLSDHFQAQYLGDGKNFEPEYLSRFGLSNIAWTDNDLVADRPSNEEFQRELYPSKFSAKERPEVIELNKIVYGPPGVGKSFSIMQELREIGGLVPVITTLHPEYTYTDFVGSFRPATEPQGKSKQAITYKFRPEAFINAYVEAWKNPNENIFLIIEEINRGNSAAVFGDVFQLLDRDTDGFSEYAISCREEISKYLEEAFAGTDYADRLKSIYDVKFGKELSEPYSILLLPSNLVIRATMNTSDQSLFPMDSAFKRRWTWEYMPIRYDYTDKRIVVGEVQFSWNEFLQRINDLIYEILETEDKCIGVFFVKTPVISANEFRNKVVFYIWNDILRDELPETKLRIFPRKKTTNGKESDLPVNFNDFFHQERGWEYIQTMLLNIGLQPLPNSDNAPSI